VYWQVVLLGVAVAVAVVILGLAVFMPPAPPTPPQLYVKVVPSGGSYLLYVNDSKALREVWYSRNGGPLLKADGPIRAECGDRVELMAVYEDGSRQTVSAVVKCSKPLVVPPRSEPKPDVATFTKLSDALGEAADGLMGNLPYKVYVRSATCSDLGATFDVEIQPLPYGSLLGLKYVKVSGTAGRRDGKCNDFNGLCISTTTYGFTLKYTAPVYCAPGPCTWSRDAAYTFWVNYTAPGTSAFASDYQGEAKTNATMYFFGRCMWIDRCGIRDGEYRCWKEPLCVYYLHWNNQRIGECVWKPETVTETRREPIYRRYNSTCLNVLDFLEINKKGYIPQPKASDLTTIFGWVNVQGQFTNMQSENTYTGMSCVRVWYKGNDPTAALNKSNWVNYGLELTFTTQQIEINPAPQYKVFGDIALNVTGSSVTVYVPDFNIKFFEDNGDYVFSCMGGPCRLYKYFDDRYIAGYNVYNVTRIVGFVNLATGSARGAGFGIQIPDLYFITTVNWANYNVNKTSSIIVNINGQQAAVYQITG